MIKLLAISTTLVASVVVTPNSEYEKSSKNTNKTNEIKVSQAKTRTSIFKQISGNLVSLAILLPVYKKINNEESTVNNQKISIIGDNNSHNKIIYIEK